MFALFAQIPGVPQVDVGFLDPIFNAIGVSGSIKQVLTVIIGMGLAYLYAKYGGKTPSNPNTPATPPDASKSTVVAAASGVALDDALIDKIADRIAKQIPIPAAIETTSDETIALAAVQPAGEFGAGPLRNGLGRIRDVLDAVKNEVEGIVTSIRGVNDLDGDGQPDGVDASKFFMSLIGIVNKFIAVYPYLRVILRLVGITLPAVPLKPIVITPTIATTLVAMQSPPSASATTVV